VAIPFCGLDFDVALEGIQKAQDGTLVSFRVHLVYYSSHPDTTDRRLRSLRSLTTGYLPCTPFGERKRNLSRRKYGWGQFPHFGGDSSDPLLRTSDNLRNQGPYLWTGTCTLQTGRGVVNEFLSDLKEIRQRARKHLEQGPVTDGYKADRTKVIAVLNEV
jgi:hypothetical protein